MASLALKNIFNLYLVLLVQTLIRFVLEDKTVYLPNCLFISTTSIAMYFVLWTGEELPEVTPQVIVWYHGLRSKWKALEHDRFAMRALAFVAYLPKSVIGRE